MRLTLKKTKHWLLSSWHFQIRYCIIPGCTRNNNFWLAYHLPLTTAWLPVSIKRQLFPRRGSRESHMLGTAWGELRVLSIAECMCGCLHTHTSPSYTPFYNKDKGISPCSRSLRGFWFPGKGQDNLSCHLWEFSCLSRLGKRVDIWIFSRWLFLSFFINQIACKTWVKTQCLWVDWRKKPMFSSTTALP